jgi:hypothetical protein
MRRNFLSDSVFPDKNLSGEFSTALLAILLGLIFPAAVTPPKNWMRHLTRLSPEAKTQIQETN